MPKYNTDQKSKNTKNSAPKTPDSISRRTFIKELGIAGASTLSLLGSNAIAQNTQNANVNTKPNILLIMTDQQRWDAMSCSGDWVQTPNMDRIANEGVRFTNCVTTSPVCIPARLNLATGLYSHNTGVWNNSNHTMAPDTPTWMQAVRDAGYRTSVFGKTHFTPHSNGVDLRTREHLMHAYGLDDVDEIPGPRASRRVLSHMTAIWQEKGLWEAYRADLEERFSNKPHTIGPTILGLEYDADVYVGQQAKQYLSNYSREEPWCCWVSFGGPHEPWDAPEPYASMYDSNTMPPAVPRPPTGGRQTGHLDNLMQTNRRSPTFEPGEIGRLRADYAGNVTMIDDQIGEILQTIQDRGELENTVIVVCSDHGEMNGDYGLIYKSNFLNGSVRIPCLVRTPDTLNNSSLDRVCDSPVEWIDIGPTLIELAGGEINYQQFGKSLCPVLQDTNATHRDFAISQIEGETMLLSQEWKLALNSRAKPYLLFDVNNDPEETNNLVGRSEVKALETELRLQIFKHRSETQVRMDIEPKGKKFVTLGQIKRNQLLQNFPNPFNPETWIPFQLAHESNVTIHIHDTSGNLVKTLALGTRAAGTYASQADAAHWDGRNDNGELVSSGVYFYTIETGNFTATRKMLIRK